MGVGKVPEEAEGGHKHPPEGFKISKFSWAECTQTTPSPLPLEKGEQPPPVDKVSYSIQTCWLLQFLLKPLQKRGKGEKEDVKV